MVGSHSSVQLKQLLSEFWFTTCITITHPHLTTPTSPVHTFQLKHLKLSIYVACEASAELFELCVVRIDNPATLFVPTH